MTVLNFMKGDTTSRCFILCSVIAYNYEKFYI